MDETKKEKIKAIVSMTVAAFLYLVISFIAQKYVAGMDILSENKALSAVAFILITAIESVIAPITVLPLIPIATNVFGWFMTAIYSIIGWTIGSLLAFAIARKYGKPIIKKFTSLRRLEEFERRMPKENLFIAIILLKMFVQVDLLSYALGMFSRIKTRVYITATVVGVAPFAFTVAYLGTIPLKYQLIGIILGGIILLAGGWWIWNNLERIGDKRIIRRKKSNI